MSGIGNPDAKPYSVVFQYNQKARGYVGVITWTNFANKAVFDQERLSVHRDNQDVIAEGVTAEEAIALVRTTQPSAYLLSALQEATIGSDGKVDIALLSAQLQTALFAINNSVHAER